MGLNILNLFSNEKNNKPLHPASVYDGVTGNIIADITSMLYPAKVDNDTNTEADTNTSDSESQVSDNKFKMGFQLENSITDNGSNNNQIISIINPFNPGNGYQLVEKEEITLPDTIDFKFESNDDSNITIPEIYSLNDKINIESKISPSTIKDFKIEKPIVSAIGISKDKMAITKDYTDDVVPDNLMTILDSISDNRSPKTYSSNDISEDLDKEDLFSIIEASKDNKNNAKVFDNSTSNRNELNWYVNGVFKKFNSPKSPNKKNNTTSLLEKESPVAVKSIENNKNSYSAPVTSLVDVNSDLGYIGEKSKIPFYSALAAGVATIAVGAVLIGNYLGFFNNASGNAGAKLLPKNQNEIKLTSASVPHELILEGKRFHEKKYVVKKGETASGIIKKELGLKSIDYNIINEQAKKNAENNKSLRNNPLKDISSVVNGKTVYASDGILFDKIRANDTLIVYLEKNERMELNYLKSGEEILDIKTKTVYHNLDDFVKSYTGKDWKDIKVLSNKPKTPKKNIETIAEKNSYTSNSNSLNPDIASNITYLFALGAAKQKTSGNVPKKYSTLIKYSAKRLTGDNKHNVFMDDLLSSYANGSVKDTLQMVKDEYNIYMSKSALYDTLDRFGKEKNIVDKHGEFIKIRKRNLDTLENTVSNYSMVA